MVPICSSSRFFSFVRDLCWLSDGHLTCEPPAAPQVMAFYRMAESMSPMRAWNLSAGRLQISTVFMWCLFSFWRSWFLEDRHLRADSTAGVAGRWVRSSKAPSHLALQADTVCRTCCQQWPLWVACVILKLKNEKQPGQQQYQDISRLCPIQKASLDISLVSLRKLWW